MLWTFKEIASIFNSEHDYCITYYYTVQKIISEEKDLLQSVRTTEFDSRCDKCGNI